MGNPSYPGILEEIMDWPENRDFGDLSKEVTCAKRPPIQEKHAVLTGGSCHGETIRSGKKLLCGVSHNGLQKSLKDKGNHIILQK